MRTIILPSVLLPSLLLVACAGDDGPSTPVDAKVIDSGANCTVSSSDFGARGTLAGTSTFRARQAPPNVGDITAVMPLEASPPADVLIVEFYSGFAPFGTSMAPTAVVPGTYQLTGTQLQYADCGICARLGTNANADGTYEDDYMATGGTVTVTTAGTAVGGTIAFSVSNLTFEHVTIDPDTFVSTPVGDGCTTKITGGMHSSMMAAPQNKAGQAATADAGPQKLQLRIPL